MPGRLFVILSVLLHVRLQRKELFKDAAAVFAIVEGEEIEGDTRWARTTYKGYTGFVSCAWLD